MSANTCLSKSLPAILAALARLCPNLLSSIVSRGIQCQVISNPEARKESTMAHNWRFRFRFIRLLADHNRCSQSVKICNLRAFSFFCSLIRYISGRT